MREVGSVVVDVKLREEWGCFTHTRRDMRRRDAMMMYHGCRSRFVRLADVTVEFRRMAARMTDTLARLPSPSHILAWRLS